MELVVFYSFAALVFFSAIFILLTKNVIYAAFTLLLTFVGIAGIYVFLMADVVAVTQVMVYVGGILILLIFGVMFTNKLQNGKILTSHQYPLIAGLLGVGVFVLLISLIIKTDFQNLAWIQENTHQTDKNTYPTSTIEPIGLQLMTNQVLALEVVGVLLLLTLVGTALIAGRKV
ncbi:MAG: NADH-quinone oxidoreductase subunit J [Thermoflexibacter sp.]